MGRTASFARLFACQVLVLAAGCGGSSDSAPDASVDAGDTVDAGPTGASCATPAPQREAIEVTCDGVDNDCNGVVDDVANPTPWFRDLDGDGFGAGVAARFACEKPEGFVATSSDCNDADAIVNPDADELCDGVNTDCDGSTTEACGHGCQPVLRREDGHIYLFCTETQGWNQARATCMDEGFDLAVVGDAAENTWIRTEANRINTDSWWIGASDITTEGRWTWLGATPFWQGNASGAAVDGRFTKWNGNEPNNDGEEDCGEMVKNGDGAWNDNKCGHGEKFICERPAGAP